MRNLVAQVACVLAVMATITACDQSPTELETELAPQTSVFGSDNPVGAIVINLGEASEPHTSRCRISGRITHDVTVVGTPNDGAIFNCHWDDFPDAPDFGPGAAVFTGWRCTLNSKVGYEGETRNTIFTLTENNRAMAQCTFQGQFERGESPR